MSSQSEDQIMRLEVGPLPLIRNVCEQLNLEGLLAEHLKGHGNEKIPAANTLMMLVANITCGRQPLYEVKRWIQQRDPSVFGFVDWQENSLNDDRLGRALDKLYQADRASLMTQIVVQMIQSVGLDLSQIHNDSTTVKAYGKMPGKTRSGLQLARGHSKDHRPDLKQLVYTLTLSADGAVPIHYKTYAGNRTDDTTHIETWKTLCRLCGRRDFLYVADAKVCTTPQLTYIVKSGGRVVTLIPEHWKEVKAFKSQLRSQKKNKRIIWKRRIPGTDNEWEHFSCFLGTYPTQKHGYCIYWIYSSEKKKRDRKARLDQIQRTERALTEVTAKLNMYHLKTRKAIESKVMGILEHYDVKAFYRIELRKQQETGKVQMKPGRSADNTARDLQKSWFSLAWCRNQTALKQEQALDGIFPLLSTDATIVAKQALMAYKYQPRLEKRFMQFKSVHAAAPLLFKKIERVEAMMFLFFMALMVQAIIERKVREQMREKQILSLPIYPEHRLASHPTTAKVFDLFEGVSKYRLIKDNQCFKQYQDTLSEIQKKILGFLNLPEDKYWSKTGSI